MSVFHAKSSPRLAPAIKAKERCKDCERERQLRQANGEPEDARLIHRYTEESTSSEKEKDNKNDDDDDYDDMPSRTITTVLLFPKSRLSTPRTTSNHSERPGLPPRSFSSCSCHVETSGRRFRFYISPHNPKSAGPGKLQAEKAERRRRRRRWQSMRASRITRPHFLAESIGFVDCEIGLDGGRYRLQEDGIILQI